MIEINNLTAFDINESFVKKIVKGILKKEKNKTEFEVSIALVSPEIIKKINRAHLQRNRVTDVLSFPIAGLKDPFQKKNLGEIIICPQKVKKNSQNYKTDFEVEFSRVLIHGALHLLGYNHEGSAKEGERMEKKQNFYLAKFLKV